MDITSIGFGTQSPFVAGSAPDIIRFSSVYGPSVGAMGFGGVYTSGPNQGEFITDVIVRMTKRAIELSARSIVDGTSFQVQLMGLGIGGYDPTNPTVATLVDPLAQTLLNEVSDLRKPIDLYETPNNFGTLAFTTRYDQNTIPAGIGEIGLFAKILYSPNHLSEVGTYFLFAVGHQGLFTKNTHSVTTFRMFVSP